MISEQKRQEMLSILSLSMLDMPKIIAGLEAQLGRKVSEKEIHDAMNKLKSVRGS